MFPPHLPPPASSLARHRQWQGIKTILVSTLFGLLAGISGAAILIGWVWPTLSDSNGWLFSLNTASITHEQLQAKAELKIADEVFNIYKKANIDGQASYFSPADKVGDGVMSVTSGWLTAFIPNFDGHSKDWIAISQNGSLYTINRFLFDKRTSLAYLKIVPLLKNANPNQQFKVVTFSGGVSALDDVFVFSDGRWTSAVAMGQVGGQFDSHLDVVPPEAYSISESFKDGSIAIDSSGNVVGFVVGGNTVFPLSKIDYFLAGIDDKKQITYPSLGVEGSYSAEKPLVLNDEKTIGFIVAKVVGNRQFFQKNDILLEVNGRPADWENVWNAVFGNTARVRVWRSGKVLEGQIPIIQI